MSKTQCIYILKYGAGLTDASINVIIEGLKFRGEMYEIIEGMYLPSAQGTVDRQKICLLWVLIREIVDTTLDRCEAEKIEIPYDEIMNDLDSVFPGRSPIDFTFLSNCKSFDITYLELNSINKAVFIERTLEKFRIDKNETEVFLTSEIFLFERTGDVERDNLIVETLHNLKLEVPYDVYLIDTGATLNDLPEMELIKYSAMR